MGPAATHAECEKRLRRCCGPWSYCCGRWCRKWMDNSVQCRAIPSGNWVLGDDGAHEHHPPRVCGRLHSRRTLGTWRCLLRWAELWASRDPSRSIFLETRYLPYTSLRLCRCPSARLTADAPAVLLADRHHYSLLSRLLLQTENVSKPKAKAQGQSNPWVVDLGPEAVLGTRRHSEC